MEEQGYRRRPVNRRRVLQGAALGSAGLTATALLGCGKGERPAATPRAPEAKQPKRGGILVHRNGYETQGAGFDPHIIATFFSEGYTLFYQGLLTYKANTFEIEPQLAQRWEQPSPTEFVFHIQPGVKWHNKPPANGRDLTVEDVVFSLERIRSDDPRFFLRSYLNLVDKIQAVDKSRVRFTLKEPDAALLTKLSMEGMSILAPEVVEKAAGKFESADKVVGTGPFILTWVEQSVGSEYVRNPDYWKPGLPHLDGLRTVHFHDNVNAWSAFIAGRLDVTPTVPGTEIKKYLAQRGPNFTPEWGRHYNILMLYPNTRVKPFDDARVQKALRLLMITRSTLRPTQRSFTAGVGTAWSSPMRPRSGT